MDALLMVAASAAALLLAYFTYGRWLSRRVFRLDDGNTTPAHTERDDTDYVPTKKAVIFGHHFTSIAGTGPIVGPAIAVMWGWLPALLWVVFGSIFVGAVHDLGSLVISLRNKGRSIGDIAGDLLGPRARVIFLLILIVGLWIVLAIFGLVIASVLRQYPPAIFPVMFQIPLAMGIGWFVHRRGHSIVLPSVIALALMFASVVFGDAGFGPTLGGLHAFNEWAAGLPVWIWVAFLLVYSYIASVIPVWVLLQPRDYINALQLISCLVLLVLGLTAAAFLGGAAADRSDRSSPVTDGGGVTSAASDGGGTSVPSSGTRNPEPGTRPPLEIVAPLFNPTPQGAPPLIPLLFITVACGACSGFHCLVSSGTTSKQVARETDARAVGYGSMLTEGFLAVLVIAACAAGIGLGVNAQFDNTGRWKLLDNAEQAKSWFRAWELEFAVTDDQRYRAELLVPTLEPNRWKGSGQGEPTAFSHVRVTKEDHRRKAVEAAERSAYANARGTLAGYYDEDTGPINAVNAEYPVQSVQESFVSGRASFELPAGSMLRVDPDTQSAEFRGPFAFEYQYQSWSSSSGLAATVGAFVQGSANFLAALGIPLTVATALMGVLVASFAGTTMDTACRLQRYVIQELARGFLPRVNTPACRKCGYDLSGHVAGGTEEDARGSGGELPPPALASLVPPPPSVTGEERVVRCPECGVEYPAHEVYHHDRDASWARAAWFNPFKWLATVHGATIFAVISAFLLAMGPFPSTIPKSAILKGKASARIWFDVEGTWLEHVGHWLTSGGKGGLILWPLFGATNQLLAGFAFIVITAWLIAKRRPVWFIVLPAVFMLAVPASAMAWQAFIGNADNPSWLSQSNWLLVSVASITLALEAWLLIEALPRIRAFLGRRDARSPT